MSESITPTIETYRDVVICCKVRGLDPTYWNKLTIYKLEVPRFNLGLGSFGKDTLHSSIITDLYFEQRLLEMKYAAAKFLETHTRYMKISNPKDIAILDEGEHEL